MKGAKQRWADPLNWDGLQNVAKYRHFAAFYAALPDGLGDAHYRSTTDSSVEKNSGKDTATASEFRIWDSP